MTSFEGTRPNLFALPCAFQVQISLLRARTSLEEARCLSSFSVLCTGPICSDITSQIDQSVSAFYKVMRHRREEIMIDFKIIKKGLRAVPISISKKA